MREILFRAYDKTMKRYKQFDGEHDTMLISRDGKIDYYNLQNGSGFDEYILEQFTGLTDMYGQKIFEGDILRFPAKDEYEKTTFVGYEVFYHDNDCADKHIGFQMNRMHFYGHLCGGECRAKLLPKYTSQMVIIGNIHDNPELLT